MTISSAIHHRRSIRLKDYDYAEAGAYFITLCTHNRQPFFGEIVGAGLAPAQMELNEYGRIALEQWLQIPTRFDHIELDAFVVMPNHIHGILLINESAVYQNGEPQCGQPQGLPLRVALGNIVGAYKSLVANECLKIFKTKNELMGKLWQRNYWEHIIRDEQDLSNAYDYILNNPAQWETDQLYSREIT